MKKRILILGSTGSIGTQAIECARNLGCEIVGLVAGGGNPRLFMQQAELTGAKYLALADVSAASSLGIPGGESEILKIIENADYDLVINGIVGVSGMMPTLRAAQLGRTVALANKESLVAAGSIITDAVSKNGAVLFPVDSEHSAIFQCLNGVEGNSLAVPDRVRKLILTASGGIFRDIPLDELKNVSVDQAVKHPTWNMGRKITVDCATMMNKGFEIIEAMHLFSVPEDRIEVVIHRESIVHSMIEYVDGAVIAQMGNPDMKVPIQYAITFPDRYDACVDPLDFSVVNRLTFAYPDKERYPAIDLCRETVKLGGTYPAAMNAANEVAVSCFLKGMIRFTDIVPLVSGIVNSHNSINQPDIADILEADKKTREAAERKIKCI